MHIIVVFEVFRLAYLPGTQKFYTLSYITFDFTVVYKDSLVIRFNIRFRNLISSLHKFLDS